MTRNQLEVDLAVTLKRLGGDAMRLLIPPAQPAPPGFHDAPRPSSPTSLPVHVPPAPAVSSAPLPSAPAADGRRGDDEAELCARYAGDTAGLERSRRRRTELKALYGKSQAAGDTGPSAVPAGEIASVLEVHHLRPLAAGGADAWSNWVVVTPTLHALLHADPHSSVDLAAARLVVFGVTLALEVRPEHLAART